jgi:uncharacterized protein (TIGR03067 family)
MNARLLLSIPFLVVAAGFAAAFAPAPVYKEPPRPSVPSIERAIQGTWSMAYETKGKRRSRVRIDGKKWTMLSSAPGGAVREGFAYEILLDTSRSPAALDLKNPARRGAMKGIVKVEEGRLIFCYTRTDSEDERPKAFTDTHTPAGRRVLTMTLTRTE